jgi:hypothetical protein
MDINNCADNYLVREGVEGLAQTQAGAEPFQESRKSRV